MGAAASRNRGRGQPECRRRNDLEQAYRYHSRPVKQFVMYKFGMPSPEADDVVHEVFRKFAEQYPIETTDMRAFLKRCARNHIIDGRRRAALEARIRYEGRVLHGVKLDFTVEVIASSKEQVRLLQASFARLDPRSRKILLQARIEGRSCAEIAREEGLSASRVKVLLSRALETCHFALNDVRGEP